MGKDIGLSRRAIVAAGLTGGAAALTAKTTAAEPGAKAETVAAPTPTNVCRMTPRMVEGPFYFDPALVRQDITEGRPGVALKLELQVTDGATCRPIENARVDIWHCDATGQYSGYDGQGDGRAISTKGEKFLRGTQMTNATGGVTFDTIYPGWYRGRTTHIHFKVLIEEKSLLTGQLYFPDAISEAVYAGKAPYNTRTTGRDTMNSNDWIAAEDTDQITFASVREEPAGYVAALVIGVDPKAEPERGWLERIFGPRG
jgi:protocatechuate 3,4-dioxygenase beta subunit